MKSKTSTVLRVGLLNWLAGSSKPRSRPVYWGSKPEKYVVRSVTSKPRRNHNVEQWYTSSSPECWSLLSSSSLAITSRLNSWKRRGAKVDKNRTPLLVILVTPAHLSLLEDGNAFIPDLLRQEAELSQPGRVFDVVAAVVDRIPHPGAPAEGGRSMSEASPANVSSGDTASDGSEGISVAILDSSSAAPSLWATQQDSQERETTTIQQRCTLTFTISSSIRADIKIQKLARQDLASRMLQLPVANTVFQNGRTSTLFAQRWILRQEHQSNVLLVPDQKVWLPQQALDLSGLTKETSMDQSLHSNLIPITPPRTIQAAIGNIIRKVSAGGSPEANTPASGELERAITTGIENGSIPDQPAEVWALVKPRGYAPHVGCKILEVSPELDELHRALLSGCRLHKVLSGGGGWGERQGLLALDPDSSYSPRQQAFQSSSGDEQDTEAEKLQALGEVVKPGDTVTFYVCNPSSAQTKTLDLWTDFVAHSSLTPQSLIFGSLPSTMDVMPELLRTKTSSEESECVILEGCFGMLSEQGMSLTSTFNSSGTDNVTTKLDAPYTLFTICARSVAPHSEEFNQFDARSRKQDCKKATNPQSNATSVANGRMSTPNRRPANVSFGNGITQRLQSLSPDIPKTGAIPVRLFATDSHCYSQTGSGKSQVALFEAEADAEAVSLERQLRNLQIPSVALDNVDDSSTGLAEKLARLRPQLRALQPNKSKSEGPQAQATSGGRVRVRVVRSQGRRTPIERSRIRYIRRALPRYKPVDTRSLVAADEKPQAKPGETKKSREPHKNAIDPITPIRFISNTKTEDTHIEVPSKSGSELSEKSIEQDVEPIQIRRHLSFGEARQLPIPVSRIRRVPGVYFTKHVAAEKMATNPEGDLLIRKYGVNHRSQERASDLPHSTSAPDIQEIKSDSPKDQARELHSKYSLLSLHDTPPKETSRPREQSFTFRRYKADAKWPILVPS